MKIYRKKPVTVGATRYRNTPEINRLISGLSKGSKTPAFMDTEIRNCSPEHPDGFDYPVLMINTLDGLMIVREGDFVIKGTQGEFYPCKPDAFHDTYEKI